MALLTLKVMASLLQLHGPGATVQSDHQGIDALLGDLRAPGPEHAQGQAQEQAQGQEQAVVPEQPAFTQVYFRRGGFVRGGGYGGGAFRRGAGYGYPGGFRRGFVRGY